MCTHLGLCDLVIYKVYIDDFIQGIASGFINFWNIFLEDALFHNLMK